VSAEQSSHEPGTEQHQPAAKAEQGDLARELNDIVRQHKSETTVPDPVSAGAMEREKTKAHNMLTAARDKLRAIHGEAESPDNQDAAASGDQTAVPSKQRRTRGSLLGRRGKPAQSDRAPGDDSDLVNSLLADTQARIAEHGRNAEAAAHASKPNVADRLANMTEAEGQQPASTEEVAAAKSVLEIISNGVDRRTQAVQAILDGQKAKAAEAPANNQTPEAPALTGHRAEAVQKVADAYKAKEAELPEGDVALRAALREQGALAVKAERARQEGDVRAEAAKLAREVRSKLHEQAMAELRAKHEAELAEISREGDERRAADRELAEARANQRRAEQQQREAQGTQPYDPAFGELHARLDAERAARPDQGQPPTQWRPVSAPEARPPAPASATRSEAPADGAPLSAVEQAAFNDIVANYDQTAVRSPTKEPTTTGRSVGAGSAVNNEIGQPPDVTQLADIPGQETRFIDVGSVAGHDKQQAQQPKTPWWQRLFRRAQQQRQQQRPPRR
jgi:hypothetical protein